jgi:UDP-N-acetylglucosamine transferase subunit ALG13
VEIKWFQALAQHASIPEVPSLSNDASHFLENLIQNLDNNEIQKIKEIEKTTQHDVKAVEYFIKEKFDILILLSGVEPQRSILETNLLEKFRDAQKKMVLVRGANSDIVVENKNIQVINFAFGAELKTLMLNADIIICRSGYSTLMDMHILKKEKLILIPTPGQPEQEYLADYWKEKFGAKVCGQKNISFFNFDKSNF